MPFSDAGRPSATTTASASMISRMRGKEPWVEFGDRVDVDVGHAVAHGLGDGAGCGPGFAWTGPW